MLARPGFLDERGFAFSKPPYAGESLVGFVARNAEIHGVERISTALKPAGIVTARPGFLPMTAAGAAGDIACVFRTTESEILARCHPPVDPPGRPRNAFVDFFGTPLRAKYLETRVRRVAPSSFANGAFHRAMWCLRPLAFCPETGCELLGLCPDCGAGLAWTWTAGVAFCEHCRADLSRMSQSMIDGFDDPAVAFVSGLIDPIAERRSASVAAMPSICGASRGDLFEFCVALGRAAGDLRSARKPGAASDDMSHLSALPVPDLALAGRIVMNWGADGLAPLIEFAARATSDRRGVWGASDEFVRVRAIPRNRHLHPAIRSACEQSLVREMQRYLAPVRNRRFRDEAATITAMEGEKFGVTCRMARMWRRRGLLNATVNPDAKTSVVVMDRDELLRIAIERKGALPRPDVSDRLGIGAPVVIRLAAIGLIETVQSPVADTLSTDHFRGASVEDFIARIAALARPATAPVVSLAQAVGKVRGAEEDRVWAGAFAAAIDGRLPVFLLSAPGLPAARLAVLPDADLSVFAAQVRADGYGGARFSGKEARDYLKASLNTITLLIEEKVLRDNGSRQQKLDFADVEAFRLRYAVTNEVAVRFGIAPIAAARMLKAGGLKPARTLSDGTLIWDRGEVEKVIGRI